MIKKIFVTFLSVMICLSMAISASAYTSQYIYDPESHLSNEEYFEINSYAEKLEAISGYAIIFCIINDNGGVSNAEFAKETYFSCTDADNALIFVHNEAESDYGYYVAGDENGLFTDQTLNAMQVAYDSNESYYGGLVGFYAAAETIVENAPYINQPENSEEESFVYTTGFVPVERKLPLVVDNAGLLSENEENELLSRCETILSEYEMEIAILTVNDLDGKTAEAYADDFYDYNGYGWGENDDGMLVLYKPGESGERELHITTHGKGNSVFYDSIREDIFEDMKNFIIDEDYFGAFDAYLETAEAQLKPGVPLTWLFWFMLGGALIGLIIIGAIISKNISVISQTNARVYTRQGSMNVTGASDVFLYSFVNARPKPQNNSGSGSSTHTSSSGRSHGGTGGKF